MDHYSLELLFLAPKGGQHTGPVTSHIYVKKYGSRSYPGEEEVESLTLCSCRGIEELEREINRLQNELEAIRQRARKKYLGEEAK